MSIQRRSFQLFSPASASCTPLAPSTSVHLNGAPSKRWRMNISHSILNPLSYESPGTSLQVLKKSIGCGTSGFHTGRGVFTRARSEEHTSELQSHSDLVCRLLLE